MGTYKEVVSIEAKDNTTRGVRSAQNKLNALDRTLKRVQTTMMGFVGINIAAGLVGGMIRLSDQAIELDSKLRIMTSSVRDYSQASRELKAISRETGSSLAANITLFTRINPSIRAMGGSIELATGLTRALAQSLRLSGASIQETSSTITQFSQAMASGVLRGEEFRALTENSPVLMKAMSDALGVTIGELREMSLAGELSAKVVTDAIASQFDEIEKMHANMPQTIGRAWQNIENSALSYFTNLKEENGNIATILNGVADNFDKVVAAVSRLAAGYLALMTVQVASNIQKHIADRIKSAAATKRETLATKALAEAEQVAAAAKTASTTASVRAEAIAATAAASKQVRIVKELAQEELLLRSKLATAIAAEKAAVIDEARQAAILTTAAAQTKLEASTAKLALAQGKLTTLTAADTLATKKNAAVKVATAAKVEVVNTKAIITATRLAAANQAKAISGLKAERDLAQAAVYTAQAQLKASGASEAVILAYGKTSTAAMHLATVTGKLAGVELAHVKTMQASAAATHAANTQAVASAAARHVAVTKSIVATVAAEQKSLASKVKLEIADRRAAGATDKVILAYTRYSASAIKLRLITEKLTLKKGALTLAMERNSIAAGINAKALAAVSTASAVAAGAAGGVGAALGAVAGKGGAAATSVGRLGAMVAAFSAAVATKLPMVTRAVKGLWVATKLVSTALFGWVGLAAWVAFEVASYFFDMGKAWDATVDGFKVGAAWFTKWGKDYRDELAKIKADRAASNKIEIEEAKAIEEGYKDLADKTKKLKELTEKRAAAIELLGVKSLTAAGGVKKLASAEELAAAEAKKMQKAALDALELIIASGDSSAAALEEAFRGALAFTSNRAGLKSMIASLTRVGEAGRLSGEQVSALQAVIADKMPKLASGVDEVGAAVRDLGVDAISTGKGLTEAGSKAISNITTLANASVEAFASLGDNSKAVGDVIYESLVKAIEAVGTTKGVFALQHQMNKLTSNVELTEEQYASLAQTIQDKTTEILSSGEDLGTYSETLSDALDDLEVDIEKALTGISELETEAIDSFQAIAEEIKLTGDSAKDAAVIMEAAFVSSLTKMTSTKAIDELVKKFKAAGGSISKAMKDGETAAEKVSTKIRELAEDAEDAGDAMENFNDAIDSAESVQHLEELKLAILRANVAGKVSSEEYKESLVRIAAAIKEIIKLKGESAKADQHAAATATAAATKSFSRSVLITAEQNAARMGVTVDALKATFQEYKLMQADLERSYNEAPGATAYRMHNEALVAAQAELAAAWDKARKKEARYAEAASDLVGKSVQELELLQTRMLAAVRTSSTPIDLSQSLDRVRDRLQEIADEAKSAEDELAQLTIELAGANGNTERQAELQHQLRIDAMKAKAAAAAAEGNVEAAATYNKALQTLATIGQKELSNRTEAEAERVRAEKERKAEEKARKKEAADREAKRAADKKARDDKRAADDIARKAKQAADDREQKRKELSDAATTKATEKAAEIASNSANDRAVLAAASVAKRIKDANVASSVSSNIASTTAQPTRRSREYISLKLSLGGGRSSTGTFPATHDTMSLINELKEAGMSS